HGAGTCDSVCRKGGHGVEQAAALLGQDVLLVRAAVTRISTARIRRFAPASDRRRASQMVS
ncbi:hypothetical protein, partial [Kibdelosporangium aridum]|uniref:hypothetical protein n=1 Tax=Kibdelosporangium aridum TaxID=2030 RepID=UPI001C8BC6DC